MSLQKALRQEQILLITSYFCTGNDWNSIYGATLRFPDEINCMWHWWMAFVKSAIEKCITIQFIKLLTISMHFWRRFSCQHNLKGKSVSSWVVVCYRVQWHFGGLREHISFKCTAWLVKCQCCFVKVSFGNCCFIKTFSLRQNLLFFYLSLPLV